MSLSYNERLSFIPFQVRPVWCDCIPPLHSYVRFFLNLSLLIWPPSSVSSLLMFGSGVPTAEKPQAKKFFLMSYGENAKQEYVHAWSNYKEYLRRTSILIPIPPVVYRPLPLLLKQTLLLDFPMYQFDEGRDGAVAVEQSRQDSVWGSGCGRAVEGQHWSTSCYLCKLSTFAIAFHIQFSEFLLQNPSACEKFSARFGSLVAASVFNLFRNLLRR